MKPRHLALLFAGTFAFPTVAIFFLTGPGFTSHLPERDPAPALGPGVSFAGSERFAPKPASVVTPVAEGKPEVADYADSLRGILDASADPESELANLFRDWLCHDLAAAVRFVERIPDERTARQLRRHLLFAWSELDPDAALYWITTLPDEVDRTVAIAHVFLGLSERTPAEAVGFATDYRIGETLPGLFTTLIARWATDDLSGALQWVQRQEPGDPRDEWLARVAFQYAQRDPATAAKVAADGIVGEKARTEAMVSILHQWALRDIDAALAWARRFDDPALAERAVSELEAFLRYDGGFEKR